MPTINISRIMRYYFSKKSLSFFMLLFLFIALPLATLMALHQQEIRQHAAGGGVNPMLLISRGKPAYAHSPGSTPTDGNDNTFDTLWWGDTVDWLIYDLSSVPVAQRQKNLLVWYNESNSYDHLLIGEDVYNMPSIYTIEVNTAPGGGQPPTTGWTTVVTEPGNHLRSRQYTFNMNGANWVRLNVTGTDGAAQNMGNRINMDIYDASTGTDDDFIDYGDSITAAAMGHTSAGTTKSIGDIIHAQSPTHFPVEENGGTGYLTTADGVTNINKWLAVFPGKYVGLSFGTNDSWGCGGASSVATTVYNGYATMIQAIIAAGKIPIIGQMPWSTHSDLATCAVAVNAKLKTLVNTYPQAFIGPDLYTATANHPEYFGDGVHPNDQGSAIFRQAWANLFLNTIYAQTGVTVTPTPTNAITPTPTAGITNTPTPTPTAIPTTPTPSPTFSGLHVSGNKLVNDQGQQVILRGVNRSGTEYMCIGGNGIFDGPSDATSVQAMKSWGINAVNVLLNEDCWLGINGVPTSMGGAAYQQAIVNYVNLLESNQIYPIVVYMWGAPGTQKAQGHPAMPDADHTPAFWTSVANTFKTDTKVLLRLQEEPHLAEGTSTAAWQCWKNGGSSCNEGYIAVGFQSLTDTVRATGATNVIQLPGLAWSSVTDQLLTYKPPDPLNNEMVAVDVYPGGGPNDSSDCVGVSCYNAQYAPILAQMPFMAGEFGESVNADVCSVSASNTFMDWMDQHSSGYLAWVWDTWGTSCGDLSLITNYNGTAHSPNGTNFKTHLATVLGGTTSTPTPTVPTATPTPTLTPSPTPTLPPGTTIIDDSVTGTGQNQFTYTGTGWSHCTNCNETNPTVTYYNASQSWTTTANDSVTLTFTGTQMAFYAVTAPSHGIGAVSIDGGIETNVDFYSVNKTGNVSLWASPVLSSGTHTFKLRSTGTKNASSSDIVITIDRVTITNTGTTPTVPPSATPTPTLTPTFVKGDINHSGCINILDFNLWLQAYQGHPVAGTFPDVNNDGVIDILDFNSWLTTLSSIYNSNPNDPRLCTN